MIFRLCNQRVEQNGETDEHGPAVRERVHSPAVVDAGRVAGYDRRGRQVSALSNEFIPQ